jgi:bacillithiol biosynthesis deacetylase BshB1
MKTDILAIGAHPDDIELSASGTIALHIAQGKTVAYVDLTHGELGTRGNADLRYKEAMAAAEILGVKHREFLNLKDGFLSESEEALREVISAIRHYRPEIILCNAIADRHPDHGNAGALVSRAAYLSGLRKIETTRHGNPQNAWRPRAVYHYIQDYFIKPDIVLDITPFWHLKAQSISAFSSQFYNPNSPEPQSPISGKDFMDFIEGKARVFGRYLGVEYAEGFTVDRPVGTPDLLSLM